MLIVVSNATEEKEALESLNTLGFEWLDGDDLLSFTPSSDSVSGIKFPYVLSVDEDDYDVQLVESISPDVLSITKELNKFIRVELLR